MHAIAAASSLRVDTSASQATLTGGPKRSSTSRVFRHKFKTATPDLLVREDVFEFDTALRNAVAWKTHKTPVFQAVRTDDLKLLDRILDAIAAFAAARAT